MGANSTTKANVELRKEDVQMLAYDTLMDLNGGELHGSKQLEVKLTQFSTQ